MRHTASTFIAKCDAFQNLLKEIENEKLPCSVYGVTENAKAYFAYALAKSTDRAVLCISATESTARQRAEECGGRLFPDNDLSLRLSEAKGKDEELIRVSVLKDAARIKKPVFLSINAFLERLIPPDVFNRSCIEIKVGETHDYQELTSAFIKNGYEKTGTVYSPGEFARRGEILDVFPPDSKDPVRITFFDNEVESIKKFESESQRSKKQSEESYRFPPAREVVLDEPAQEKLFAYLKNQDNAPLREKIMAEAEEFGYFENADTFLSVLYKDAHLTDYFPDALILFDDLERIEGESKRVLSEFHDAFNALLKEGEVFAAQEDCLEPLSKIIHKQESKIIDLAISKTSGIKTVGSVEMNIRSAPEYNGMLANVARGIKERRKHGYSVCIFAGAKAQSLSKNLLEWDIVAPVEKKPKSAVSISEEYLPYGFEIPSGRVMLYGTHDIYGRSKKKIASKRKKNRDADIFSDLKPGDYVVHDEHGKGRYLGLKTLETDGVLNEYMEIEYRGGDRLFIGTGQIDCVQKYIGNEDAPPVLSKLGGKEWETAKAKTKESALKLAFDLVGLYAQRFQNEGYSFSEDTVWQKQFEDAFEYEETDGQLESAEEIKKDMESSRPMDRLLLGDVGYGKTEVAMRAAMKAVMDGKQVAVLVPTTLLARQHLKTFRERFADFPVDIAGLSRLTKSKHKKILDDLRRGKIDIIIGTHRLLSKDVRFNNLGLLIVDEEQRFGVSHKEKIKLLKQNVDVLTLSATPIPRTLEMSLVGVRDMSTLETPPAMRKPPYTYVMRYSDGLLRDAVKRELERDGQVYFVCRQIKEMDKLIEDVRRCVPEARVAAAHGQMNEAELEDIVSRFIDGEYDVLVCTTIIENGIDIPDVNTIIVYEADKFGLSQLYQLKGRVGRSDKTAYAYFTYLGDRILNEDAKKRLAAIKEFAQLGSGFKIAMRDLQIRGAGNLLGPEQSGHMASVGYAMYCKIMKDAIAQVKGEPLPETFETAVEFNAPAYIPDSYISDQADKMDIYKLIVKIKSVDDAKAAEKEIADRYGKIPKEVRNLIVIAAVRSYAAEAGIASVIQKKDGIEMKYSESVCVNVKKLLKVLSAYGKDVVLRPSQPPAIVYAVKKGFKISDLIRFLRKLRVIRRAAARGAACKNKDAGV